MGTYTLITPLEIYLPRKTKKDVKYILNINHYRNTYFQVLNQAKSIYTSQLKNQILQLPQFKHLDEVSYKIFKKSSREFDTPNIGSIVSKFFMDALVEYKRIPDDNYKITPRHVIDFGGVGQSDYCEITIKGTEMNISINLDHEDIIKAITNTFGDSISADNIKNLKFELKDGKVTASVQTGFAKPKTVESVAATPRTTRRKTLTEEFTEATNNTVNNISPSDKESSSGEPDIVTASDNWEHPTENNEEDSKTIEEPKEEISEPSEENTETVEEVKTNTFGSRNIRRRIL